MQKNEHVIKKYLTIIFIILAVTLIILAVTGCDRSETTSTRNRFERNGFMRGMYLITDTNTGVQYLVCGFGGVTPVLNADGTPYNIYQ